MDEKDFLLLCWDVATDSIKNAAHGNQDIGALNECFMELRKRLNAVGVTNEEISEHSK